MKYYEMLLEKMFAIVEVAIEHGYIGTEDMIEDFIKKREKNHWMMTAFSNKN